ncbi:MAG: hypothetical protein LQ348_004262 [Seirophora lacunosa]|nr:MAG: hypothetical protein LQ348_004262 [Seirophora lacunosa]
MPVKLPKNPFFSASFKPNVYFPSYPMQCILDDPTHALRPLVESRMRSRIRRGLWLRISANSMGAKAMVRRWAKRRVQEAVREELEAKHFGMDGVRMKVPKKEVRGTMELSVRQPTVGAEWGDLKTEVRRLVEAVVHMAEAKTEAKMHKEKARS